jgi:uncharacterized protein (DUF1800 family)
MSDGITAISLAETSALKKRKRKRKKPHRKSARCPKPTKKQLAKARAEAKRHPKRKKKPLKCRPKHKKPARPKPGPLAPSGPTGASPAPGGGVPAPPPPPAPPAGESITSPIAMYQGPWGRAQAERLLWRAGFGPRKGDVEKVVAMGMQKAVMRFTRPKGAPVLTGPEPTNGSGGPLAPADAYGQDHAYWLDRMIRSDQQLVERMALVFHDWFATSIDGIALQAWMLVQTNLFRKHGLGSFRDLVYDISQDFAMINWLDLQRNIKGRVNENYARELMELFTLGADRGAYTEQDVREAARALSGWTGVWDDSIGNYRSFYFDPKNHDDGVKTVFGKTGKFTWSDIAAMVVDHPKHATFFVNKLWGYFIPTPPPDDKLQALAKLYAGSGNQIRPVLEAILCSPEFHAGPRMVKPPVVHHAGMMRIREVYINRPDWHWFSMMAGQRLYQPPDVSGWDDKRWLNTNTVPWRWAIAAQVFMGGMVPSTEWDAYSTTETPKESVDRALACWDSPTISAATRAELESLAAKWAARPDKKAQCQNVLRQIIPTLPDYLTC